MDFPDYLILFSSVILGGGLAFYFQKNNKTILQLVLSFSGAFILGISVLHLMPVAFSNPIDASAETISKHGNTVGLLILLGFFVQIFLEQLSKGVEHGHIHAPHHGKTSFAIQILLGLSIHAFFEGIPLENEHMHAHAGHNHLLWGIVLHKAPAAFALVLLFLISGFKKPLIVSALLVFALMSPLGAYMGKILTEHKVLTMERQNYVVAFVIGSFLHIATTILFEVESAEHHSISMRKLIAILIGIGMAILTIL
ncbi:MAG: ZIP family metal transporter [Saprospiraceae bacterium]